MKKIYLIIVLVFSLVPLCLSCLQDENKQSAYDITVDLDYRAFQPGEVIKLSIKDISDIKVVQSRFLGKKYCFGKGRNASEALVFIGLDLGLKPGTYQMDISVLYDDGKIQHLKKKISVVEKEFPVKRLWVEEKFVTPPPKVHERIRWESELLRAVYDIFTPRWLGDGKFIIPSEGKAVPNFGERRIFNNKPRSSHSGVDITSPFGSPVKASNSGKIVLANDLYFAGKTVIIDHGLGVFTLYCHFSRILVKRGTFVKRGEIIGEIGATGRVTGPHLHWGVKILGSRVDPFSLLSLEFE